MTSAPCADQALVDPLAEGEEVCAFPASLGQERFWFLDQIEKGNPAFNIAVRFALKGALDVAILERAFNELVSRHEILRTTFGMSDGHLTQWIRPAPAIATPVNDLRSLDQPERDEEANRLTVVEARKRFDLTSGPLLRASLLRLEDECYELMLTVHHIVADGWSIGVIANELGVIYEAFARHRKSPLPDLPIQYADFTVWRKEQLQDGSLDPDREYWKKQLENVAQFEVLPDKPRPPVQTSNGTILSLLLPKSLTNALKELGGRHGATLFMTALAVFKMLMHRYTGQDDIVIGSQIAGRNRVELEPLIGPFINTLVLRTDVSGYPAFPELLGRVRDMAADSVAHQEMPFELLVEELRPERDPSRNVIFQVNFIYQRDFIKPLEFSGLSLTAIPSKSPGAIYDLNFFMVERAEGWRLSCEYNTDLFEADSITRMLNHFRTLLEGVAENPQRRVSEFPLLSDAERALIVTGWNGTRAEYRAHRTVAQLFEDQAARTPGAIAAVFEKEKATYGELNERANQLAHYLQKRAAGPGVLVGICVERSLDMLAGILAILKAGSAYVPLDPGFPRERLAYMLEDSGLPLLLTSERLVTELNPKTAATVCLDRDRAEIARENTANPTAASKPDDLAYVIYTSGSTGKPKGVEIQNRALVNLLEAMRREPGLTASDVLVAVTTLSFDIAGLELLLPLLAGASVAIASREQASQGGPLLQLLESSRATVLQATPATWRMLIEAGWKRTPALKMLCGGEALSRSLANELIDRGAELWNMYGPTETTIWSSASRVERGNGPVLLGGPIANTQFYILDGEGEPAPIGAPGELCIGGDGLARGYLKKPELTAERFVRDPFSPKPEARIYRTGDRARYLANGKIEFLGRMDFQVKVRGFRIELGEIESALLRRPELKEAVVIVREDAGAEPYLAAYIVSAGDAPTSEALREHLRQGLPDYMIPSAFVVLDRLPLTPNGKVDRRALPAPERSMPQQNSFRAARDVLERKLTGIWENVLNIHPIAVDDNFFDLGGHSLLAARLFAQIHKKLGKTLPLATLFQAPSIEKLAAAIRDSGWTPPWSPLVSIRPNGSKPPFFFVHPIGGNVLNFRGFASHLSADQPVYGLQAQGLDGKQAPHLRVEDMAADYIKEIRTVQPNGPYYLGGFSAGAIVAFEMSRQLHKAGEEVALLALLDSFFTGSIKSMDAAGAYRVRLNRSVRTLRFNLGYMARIGLKEFAAKKTKNLKLRTGIGMWRVSRTLNENISGAIPKINLGVEQAFLVAVADYVPRPYPDKAVLFRAKDQAGFYSEDPLLGWGKWIAGGLEIRGVSGDHDTILHEPHIGVLARELNACLEEIQAAIPAR
ncbi:MAG: non-ribosomal peptide synthetase [Bryobacteraceae bacterium]